MPTTVTLYLCLVWFVFGLFMGLGWSVIGWLFTKIMTALNV